MKIGLFVDDIRDIPDKYKPLNIEWTKVTNFNDAIEHLRKYQYDYVSLDHDLASFYNGREKTGYDICMFLATMKHFGEYVPSNILLHSANPVGVKNMQAVIDRYLK